MSSDAAQQQEPVWDGNRVEMISEKLASDVYAFYDKNAGELNAKGGAAGTSSGLIIGERGSLLIETISHGDHWYGNMYLPATTLIIQHIHAKQYIDEHLEDDKQFMLQNFGHGRGIEEIQPRTGDILVEKGSKIRIDLGGKLVEIIDFGFAQTGGDIFVWEPQSKVLWAGNPIISSKPALPWLLDGHLIETHETLKKVYEFLPSDARIIPGHGVMIEREDLQWHIDYLTTIQSNVQKAITQGLNKEETVKKITNDMKDFRGYVLFDWIHSSLNVPKAFEELESNNN